MKTQIKIVAVVIASLLSVSAFAESTLKKATTRIDFNNMIDSNNRDKNSLQQSVATEANEAEQTAAADQKKVMDFVDIEVGMGQARPVVDRRFNSIGEARVDTTFTVELIAKDGN